MHKGSSRAAPMLSSPTQTEMFKNQQRSNIPMLMISNWTTVYYQQGAKPLIARLKAIVQATCGCNDGPLLAVADHQWQTLSIEQVCARAGDSFVLRVLSSDLSHLNSS